MKPGLLESLLSSCFPITRQGQVLGPHSREKQLSARPDVIFEEKKLNSSGTKAVQVSSTCDLCCILCWNQLPITCRLAYAHTQDDVATSQHTATEAAEVPAGPCASAPAAPEKAEGSSVSWLEMASLAAPTLHVVLTDEGAMLGSLGPLGTGLHALWRPRRTAASSSEGQSLVHVQQLQDAPPMHAALAGLLGADVAAQALQGCAEGRVFRGPVLFEAVAHMMAQGNRYAPSLPPSEGVSGPLRVASNHQQMLRQQDLCTAPTHSGTRALGSSGALGVVVCCSGCPEQQRR